MEGGGRVARGKPVKPKVCLRRSAENRMARVKGSFGWVRAVAFPQLSILNTGQLSKRPRGNDLLLILQRSGKCLSGANHILCVLLEANYSFGIFLLPY